MHVEYYPTRGRGAAGDKFQLARFRDENGETYKGQYDQERQFGSEEELKEHLASVMNVPAGDITLSKMHL